MKTTPAPTDAPPQRKASAAQPRANLARPVKKGLPRPLPVFHGKGGLAAGLTGLSNKALLDAADK